MEPNFTLAYQLKTVCYQVRGCVVVVVVDVVVATIIISNDCYFIVR
jgi:hypothetical protein